MRSRATASEPLLPTEKARAWRRPIENPPAQDMWPIRASTWSSGGCGAEVPPAARRGSRVVPRANHAGQRGRQDEQKASDVAWEAAGRQARPHRRGVPSRNVDVGVTTAPADGAQRIARNE